MSENVASASDRLKTLYGILDFLAQVRDLDEHKVWCRILEKLSLALDTEAATYYLLWSNGRQIVSHYALGPLSENLSRIPVALGQGVSGWVASHREPLLIDDAYQDARFMKDVDEMTGFKTRTILCLPLMDRLDLSGVLQFINKRSGPFTVEDLVFTQAVCREVAACLRVLRLESMLNKVTSYNASILDNLTGGFLAVDLRGRVMICNPAARRILELREDISGSPAEQALKEVGGIAGILMQTLADRQTVKRREWLWSHGKEPRVLGYSTILIQDTQGNMTGAGITFQDITDLQKK